MTIKYPPWNLHQILNASSRRGGVDQQVLECPLKYGSVIVGFNKLVQQHGLTAACFRPRNTTIFTPATLWSNSYFAEPSNIFHDTFKRPRFNLYNCEACPTLARPTLDGSVRPDSYLASCGRRECILGRITSRPRALTLKVSYTSRARPCGSEPYGFLACELDAEALRNGTAAVVHVLAAFSLTEWLFKCRNATLFRRRARSRS